ncbi:MAG: SMP-30/gluconolactonase/LRE family protein [Alphaproteobacteria bacterium]|nr:SMP-30/gluconolactonase/LRE family protein [Alphaproteobacteria bacterium]
MQTINDFEVWDKRFLPYVLGNVRLEKLHSGMRWAEGPVWFADGGYVLWSDIPNNRMMRWIEGVGAHVWRFPANNSNGNTRDREGRLVTCEHGARRVTRTEADGSITVLADRWKGQRLNSPNDVVVKSDGSIWFTDPPYGILTDYEGNKGKSEIGRCNVYRIDPRSGAVDVVIDDMVRPNGIAFDPKEEKLYVADTGNSDGEEGAPNIRVYDVSGKRARNGRLFVKLSPGLADGFRFDTQGNLWTSAGDGVHCYTPKGDLVGKVLVPEVVANLCFGGPKRNRLYITATTSLYAIHIGGNGAMVP